MGAAISFQCGVKNRESTRQSWQPESQPTGEHDSLQGRLRKTLLSQHINQCIQVFLLPFLGRCFVLSQFTALYYWYGTRMTPKSSYECIIILVILKLCGVFQRAEHQCSRLYQPHPSIASSTIPARRRRNSLGGNRKHSGEGGKQKRTPVNVALSPLYPGTDIRS